MPFYGIISTVHGWILTNILLHLMLHIIF